MLRIHWGGLVVLQVLALWLGSNAICRGQDPPSEGLHYFVIENRTAGTIVQRGTAGSLGVAFSNLILQPNLDYRIWVLEAATLRAGRVEFTTGGPGVAIEIPEFKLRKTNAVDQDADGLQDIAEFILGTDVLDSDTDDDGLLDGPEVRQGGDPLDGAPLVTGIIASVTLPGTARDVYVLDDLLYVAHETGVTALTVFSGMSPAIVASYPVDNVATRVAASGRRALVACDTAGLLLLDFASPPSVGLVQEIPGALLPVTLLGTGDAKCVAAAGSFGYAGLANGIIVAIDLVNGFVLDSVDLGESVEDLTIAGETLYAVTSNTLHAIPLDPTNLVESGAASSTVTGGFRRVFAGGGVGYGIHGRGYNPYDLSTPSVPALILSTATSSFSWQDLAVDGAGIGIAAVGASAGNENLSIYNVSDPMPGDLASLADRFLGTLDTPGNALAVEIANGVAYVADSANGLHVVNYLAADTFGLAPTIQLVPSFDVAGVEENKRVLLEAQVDDDIGVRNVEFIVDNVSSIDASFPFQLHFVTPALADQSSFTVRARVFDTGGNFTFTDEIVVPIQPDNTAPTIVNTLPSGGAISPVTSAIALASEPLDPATIDAASFTVVSAGPDGLLGTGDEVPVTADTVEFRLDFLGALFTVDTGFAPGVYGASLAGSATDTTGNSIGGDVNWAFVVYDNPDLDGDGIPDGLLDPDGDGLITAYELILGLDPDVADFVPGTDTDNDGIVDLVELALGTSPTEYDTDGDGFGDFDEIEIGSIAIDPLSIPILFAWSPASAFNAGRIERAWVQGSAFNLGALEIAAQISSAKNLAAPEAIAGETVPTVTSVENEGMP